MRPALEMCKSEACSLSTSSEYELPSYSDFYTPPARDRLLDASIEGKESGSDAEVSSRYRSDFPLHEVDVVGDCLAGFDRSCLEAVLMIFVSWQYLERVSLAINIFSVLEDHSPLMIVYRHTWAISSGYLHHPSM